MSLLDRLVAATLPITPRFVVGKVARRYIAGEEIGDAANAIRDLNAQGVLATVDVLSGGRVELGVGTGWQPEEFEGAGVPFRGRGARMDDTLRACRVVMLPTTSAR